MGVELSYSGYKRVIFSSFFAGSFLCNFLFMLFSSELVSKEHRRAISTFNLIVSDQCNKLVK